MMMVMVLLMMFMAGILQETTILFFDGVDDDHGTHVAGTIGAVGGNGKGAAGVVWNVKMLNAKF
jgi:hypothetical protein